jgi:hypothetical protein
MKAASFAPNSREAEDWYYEYYDKERLESLGVLQ